MNRKNIIAIARMLLFFFAIIIVLVYINYLYQYVFTLIKQNTTQMYKNFRSDKSFII
jgi:hypothetical protein